jgi:hypothetical protein
LQQEVFAALQELDASDIDISVCVSDLMTLLEYCTRYTYNTSSTTTATVTRAVTAASTAAQSTLQLDASAVTNIAILMRMWEHPTATVRANAVTALQYVLAAATATANATAATASTQQQQQQAAKAKVSAIVHAVLHRCLWGMLCDNDATSSTNATAGSSGGARVACLTAWQYFLDAATATAVLQDSTNFSNLMQIAEGYYYTADDEQCLCPVYKTTIDSNDSNIDVFDEPVSKAVKTSHTATASGSSGKSVPDSTVTVTRQHGTGVTYASRALVREALVQLLLCSSSKRSKKDDVLHTVVKHAVAQSQEAAYASQREAALLLLTACSRQWQQCGSDSAVAVQSETRELVSEHIAVLLTAVKTEPTTANADGDITNVSNIQLLMSDACTIDNCRCNVYKRQQKH